MILQNIAIKMVTMIIVTALWCDHNSSSGMLKPHGQYQYVVMVWDDRAVIAACCARFEYCRGLL